MSLDIGDVARVPLTVKKDGTFVDPTSLSIVVRDPDGTETTYVYDTDDEIEKVSTGNYRALIPCTIAGKWTYRWVGTGTNAGATPDGIFMVSARSF